MRRLLAKILLGLIAVAGLAVIIYFYFPRIWGEVVYPLKYQEEIAAASQEFDLPQELIAAVIYTESGFSPEAISPMGARGLMQIMPGTGAGIAQDLGVTNFDLFHPATNIRFGAYYIKSLLNDYNNDLDLALMAYNAGHGTANLWRDYRSVLPRETQGFVRKVKSTKDNYLKIYGLDWSKPKEEVSPFKVEVKWFLYQMIFQRKK